jgi:hypothetical protein
MVEAETGRTGPQGFGGYLEAQAHNLSEIRLLPEFALVERLAHLYEHSLAIKPRDPDLRFAQLLIQCHSALLSAAATIGRALPGDRSHPACYRGGLSRCRSQDGSAELRALGRWGGQACAMGGSGQRHQAKAQRRRASRLSADIESARAKLGILSHVGVHFNPEFVSTQRVRIETEGHKAGSGMVYFPYFESSQREIERWLMFVASVHLEILEVFVPVFDGAFHRDAEWMRLRGEIGRLGKDLARAYQAEAEAPFDDREEGRGG